MKICSIICEYNPFHGGHRHHIEAVRKQTDATHIVCVMSGNYVQRGDVAIYDKWYRAKSAVKGGADLVVELPTPYVLTSAQYFASAGVYIAKQLGSTMLSFGSECGDITVLKSIAAKLALPQTQMIIHKYLDEGVPYHKAVSSAAESPILDYPNNTLGIEYIKADPLLEFHTIKRTFAHDAHDCDSAFNIRTKIRDGTLAPESDVHSITLNERAILSSLRTKSARELENISGSSEGLNNRLFKAVKTAETLEQLYDLTVSKRYPLSRIRRYVMSAFLGIEKDFPEHPTYIRVLALNERGAEILANADTPLPIISKTAGFNDPLFLKESIYTDLYNLFSEKILPCGSEYRNSLYYHK